MVYESESEGWSADLGALVDERSFLRLVLDHVSDCVAVVNRQGAVVYINRPYCRLLSGEPADFVGRHVTDVVSPHTKLHLVATRGEPIVGTLTVRGHELYTKQVPLRLHGQVVGAVGLALFTDRQEASAFAKKLGIADLQVGSESSRWPARYSIHDIIGSCPSIVRVKECIRKAAATEVGVLVRGETGTGKELVASAIHNLSARAKAPFVAVNCTTIPDDLVESELFGYEGGAFTGARSRGSLGKFELANHGTIFLDEIGDLPLRSQAALLRVLQEGEILRVGGSRPLRVDLRVICATHRDLRAMVNEGEFREDLYYRLDVMRIDTPPLRDREDFPELVEHLLEKLRMHHGIDQLSVAPQIMNHLRRMQWRGNVRELNNVLQRAVLALGPEEGFINDVAAERDDGPGATRISYQVSLADAVAATERQAIQEALSRSGGNRAEAARLLRIDRATLYNKLDKLGITAWAAGQTS